MTKKLMILGGAVLTVVLLAGALVVPALAQEGADEPGARFGCRGWGLGLGGRSWAIFDTAAEVLGLTPEGLFSELHGGKSLADVAEAQDKDLDAVQEAMGAARAEAMKEGIEQAVEDGRLTQEQADWMLEGHEKGFMPGRGGFGRGMKGRFGGSAPMRDTFAAPSPSS
jgi:hypothetical protein